MFLYEVPIDPALELNQAVQIGNVHPFEYFKACLQYYECFDLIHFQERTLIQLTQFQWDVGIFGRLAKNSLNYENF